MLEKMIEWLYIVSLYSPPKCSKKIDVYLFLCDSKKRMPTETIEIIGKPHVNSAYTYCCPVNNQIIIYRKEEWFKVFIHETMHSFGMDFCGNHSDQISKSHIGAIFDIQSNMNIYEAYCETWAVVINNAFGVFLKDATISYGDFSKQFKSQMSTEIVFSLVQMNKVLSHMGLEYTDLYSKSPASITKRDLLYHEESEIFSYFVAKTILLYHYNLFILWCDNNNHSLLNFKTTDRNIIEFCNLILSLYKNKPLLEDVKITKGIVRRMREGTFMTNTDRISAYAFEF